MGKKYDAVDEKLLTIIQAIHEEATTYDATERGAFLDAIKAEIFQIGFDTAFNQGVAPAR